MGDHIIRNTIVVIPRKDSMFANRHARVDGGELGSGGGGELRNQLGDGSRTGGLFEERHFLVFFEETPAEAVNQEEHHGIIAPARQIL